MRQLLAILLALVSAVALASDAEHMRLAQELDLVAVDRERVFAAVTDMTIKDMPELNAQRETIITQLRIYSKKPEVVESRLKMHMQNFSEQELRQVLAELNRPQPNISQEVQFKIRNPFFVSLIRFKPDLSASKPLK